MKLKHIMACAALSLPLAMAAQSINFEGQDYKKLGVWDTWEASPFRTGKLNGNCKVIDNHLNQVDDQLGEPINPSKKILAVQRSRFGSNTFGARIDLKEPFELTQTTRYLHVKLHRPYDGRVMVVGLGKRRDRAGQAPDTEQFASISSVKLPADRWVEAVMPIVGNGGIDIFSLVIVPDCESPHNYTDDKACYIDDIVINDDQMSSLDLSDYPINFQDTTHIQRTDRHFGGVTLRGSSDGEKSLTVPSSDKLAYHFMEDVVLTAKPGERLTADFTFDGSWMHTYVFMDRSCNGRFEVPVASNGHPEAGTEALSYSFFGPEGDFRNSLGQQVTASATFVDPPAFTLPEDMEHGFYRLRFKVDWNSVDPGGCVLQGNSIIGNGGGIIDVNMNVHGDMCSVNDENRNGEVLAAKDGVKLDKYQTPFNEAFTIRMRPEKGFEYAGVIVRHGHKLNGPAVVHGVRQWQEVRFERRDFNENMEYTLPAECMDGDVRVEGLFIEEGTYVEPAIPTRYATTSITDDKQFADTTSWYTIQIAQDGYVLADNNGSSYIALNNTTVDEEDPAQLWCFVGNEEVGYKLYNKQAGPTKVLAASTDLSDNTGAYAYPILYEEDKVPSGYVCVWRFEDSDQLGSNRVEHAFMYQDGYVDNKVNNRDNKLAFWNGGADGGSTLQIYFVKKDVPETTGITAPEVVRPQDNVFYDLSGRRVLEPQHGIFIQNGKKVVVE